MSKQQITIAFDGLTFAQVERARLFIHELFTAGVLGLRNGNAIISFDHEGVMTGIRFDYIRWKRDKTPTDIERLYESATIKIDTLPQPMSGQA